MDKTIPEAVRDLLPEAWLPDCQGKQDFDSDLVALSCRYYPPSYDSQGRHSVSASIIFGDALDTVAEHEFYAETEAAAKGKAEQWAAEQVASLVSTLTAAQQQGQAVASENVRRLVGALDQWRPCMSHNDSYFGEPAGLVKSVSLELARAVDPIYPPKPEPVDPLAGVTIRTATVPLSPRTEPQPMQQGGWDLNEVVCLACGDYIMPMGQLCHACSHPVTAPPSAPVGVTAAHVDTLRRVLGLLRDTAALQGREHILLGIAFTDAIDYFYRLAQQPAAVDEAMELLREIRDFLWSLPKDCMGSDTDASGQPYPIRDEVIDNITKQLATQHQEPTT